MPLIVITGYPSSGKTRLSKNLVEVLQEISDKENVTIHHICNEKLGLVPRDFLVNSTEEKKARATFISAIQRNLKKDAIVIADCLNYTKSERYQLFCVAREHNTSYCVIHLATPAEQCNFWNNDRLSSELFTEMVQRYEHPKHHQRWDNPMFVMLPDDPIPVDLICNAIFKTDKLKATLATVSNIPSSANYLYVLDKTLKEVIEGIMADQKEGQLFEGHEFLSLAELSRHKRKFISMQQTLRYSSKNQEMMTREQIVDLFKDFLKTNLSNNF